MLIAQITDMHVKKQGEMLSGTLGQLRRLWPPRFAGSPGWTRDPTCWSRPAT